MFPRCTGRTADIGIRMAWYDAFRRESDISTLSPQHFAELARGRRSAGLCAANLSRSHKQHQHESAHRYRGRAPIRHRVLARGEWARETHFYHNFRKLESGTNTPELNFCPVHPSVDSLLHPLEALPCARNDARTRDPGQGGNALRTREQRWCRRLREEGPWSRGRNQSRIDTETSLRCV
jgi:hypothetical protein